MSWSCRRETWFTTEISVCLVLNTNINSTKDVEGPRCQPFHQLSVVSQISIEKLTLQYWLSWQNLLYFLIVSSWGRIKLAETSAIANWNCSTIIAKLTIASLRDKQSQCRLVFVNFYWGWWDVNLRTESSLSCLGSASLNLQHKCV